MTIRVQIRNGFLVLSAVTIAVIIFLTSPFRTRAQAASPVVSVTSSGAGQITVSWTAIPDAALYYVYRCDKDSPYQRIASTKETTYTDTSVKNDKAYEYSVTALVNGEETVFENKGMIGYTAYKAPHIYGWNVSNLTPWEFTVSGKISYAGTANTVWIPVWTETNGQDDLQWYTAPVIKNSFSLRIITGQHGSQRGVYVMDPYLNGQAIYCASPLWVEVPNGPLMITAPEIADLSSEGFTATVIARSFNNGVKSAKAEIWTAFEAQDDLETVDASYDSETGIVSCPVKVSRHGGETGLYYVRFTVTDKTGAVKSLLLNASVPAKEKCMSLTIIDLGDGSVPGSASLLTSKGQALLIDTGRTECGAEVVRALKQHGITSVDIALTHGHNDHVGTAQAIIDAGIAIGNVYTDDYPADVMGDELDRRVSMSVFRKKASVKNMPEVITVGDATVNVMHPAKHYSLYDASSAGMLQANANSYWFVISNGRKKILICGDSELTSSLDMVHSGKDLSADYFVLGHHGAAGTLNEEILQAIAPKAAFASGRITASITSDTIKTLKNCGVKYYYTGDYGTIDLTIRGTSVSINTEKNSDSPVEYYTVTWKNADGTVLETDKLVKKGTMPSFDGGLPLMMSGGQLDYTFSGWTPAVEAVSGSVVYTAVYSISSDKIKRLWGTNRYGTTSAILRESFARGSQNKLILTSGVSFQHAILGIMVSGLYDCPLLITNQKSLSGEALRDIQRLAKEGTEVVIIGGTDIVSKAIETTLLETEKITQVRRLADSAKDVEEAALELFTKGIGEGLFAGDKTAIIVSGHSFADETTIAPYAREARVPILFTDEKGDFSANALKMLQEKGIERAILIGGTQVTSQATEDALKARGITCLRLGGSDRYRTSQAIFRWLIGEDKTAAFQPAIAFSVETLGFVTGLNFPDAIASANLMGDKRGPILLVAENRSAENVLRQTLRGRESQILRAYLFGGPDAISEYTEGKIAEAVSEDAK